MVSIKEEKSFPAEPLRSGGESLNKSGALQESSSSSAVSSGSSAAFGSAVATSVGALDSKLEGPQGRSSRVDLEAARNPAQEPFKGFTDEESYHHFDQVDISSAKLFDIVQSLQGSLKKSVIAAVKKKNGVISLRKEFPKVKVEVHWKSLVPAPAKPTSPPPPSLLPSSPFQSGKRTHDDRLLVADESIYSKDKMRKLKAVFEAGWKREIVMRAEGSKGPKVGDVFYFSPSGAQLRSTKEVEIYLRKPSNNGGLHKDKPFFTVDNFCFTVVRLGMEPDQEFVREAFTASEARALAYQQQIKSTATGKKTQFSSVQVQVRPEEDDNDEVVVDKEVWNGEKWVPVSSSRSGRSILPPKKYSDGVDLMISGERAEKRKPKNDLVSGMLPPKYPKQMESSLSGGLSSSNEESNYGYGSSNNEEEMGLNRSSSPSPHLIGSPDESLFQISALNQSGELSLDNLQQLLKSIQPEPKPLKKLKLMPRGLLDLDVDANGPFPVESEKFLDVIYGNGNELVVAGSSGVSASSGSRQNCSIYCKGRGGKLPNLQCVRCLCLVHGECVGFSQQMSTSNFMCPNCFVVYSNWKRKDSNKMLSNSMSTAAAEASSSSSSSPTPRTDSGKKRNSAMMIKQLREQQSQFIKRAPIRKVLPLNILSPPKPSWTVRTPPPPFDGRGIVAAQGGQGAQHSPTFSSKSSGGSKPKARGHGHHHHVLGKIAAAPSIFKSSPVTIVPRPDPKVFDCMNSAGDRLTFSLVPSSPKIKSHSQSPSATTTSSTSRPGPTEGMSPSSLSVSESAGAASASPFKIPTVPRGRLTLATKKTREFPTTVAAADIISVRKISVTPDLIQSQHQHQQLSSSRGTVNPNPPPQPLQGILRIGSQQFVVFNNSPAVSQLPMETIIEPVLDLDRGGRGNGNGSTTESTKAAGPFQPFRSHKEEEEGEETGLIKIPTKGFMVKVVEQKIEGAKEMRSSSSDVP